MTEVVFYHLIRKPLEKALPELLEKSYERGWRVVVQASSDERVDALDAHLWTYNDSNFLPHGTGRDVSPLNTASVGTSDSSTARLCS